MRIFCEMSWFIYTLSHIKLVTERSTWKLEVVGSISGLVNLTVINCLLEETLNRGPVWRCCTPSTLKNQAERSVVSSCIRALSPATTNRLLAASLRLAPINKKKKKKKMIILHRPTLKYQSGYRNGSISRGPETLLQTRITNPPG